MTAAHAAGFFALLSGVAFGLVANDAFAPPMKGSVVTFAIITGFAALFFIHQEPS